jgi:hypothetical protein
MVPAKGEAQAISDLIAGQVDFYFGNASQLLPHADTERIRLLAAGDCAAYRLTKLGIVPCSRTSRLVGLFPEARYHRCRDRPRSANAQVG